jgi:hypothetical protein
LRRKSNNEMNLPTIHLVQKLQHLSTAKATAFYVEKRTFTKHLPGTKATAFTLYKSYSILRKQPRHLNVLFKYAKKRLRTLVFTLY